MAIASPLQIGTRSAWQRFSSESAGTQIVARVFLDPGAKWNAVSMSPEDAEFMSARRFSTEELCRLYGDPPTVIGDLSNSSFTNSETTIRWFAQSTLAPWIAKVEREFSRSFFSASSNRCLDLDVSGLMRGDPEQRWKDWEIAITNKILPVDEIRQAEGMLAERRTNDIGGTRRGWPPIGQPPTATSRAIKIAIGGKPTTGAAHPQCRTDRQHTGGATA